MFRQPVRFPLLKTNASLSKKLVRQNKRNQDKCFYKFHDHSKLAVRWQQYNIPSKSKKKKKSVTSTDADVLPYKYFKISLSQPPDFQWKKKSEEIK